MTKRTSSDPLFLAVAVAFSAAAAGLVLSSPRGGDEPKAFQDRVAQTSPAEEIKAVLTQKPQAPEVKNTACGPETTFTNVSFDCVGNRPRGVQIGRVVLSFADAGKGDEVCVGHEHCRPVDALGKEAKDGFERWRNEAFSRYRP